MSTRESIAIATMLASLGVCSWTLARPTPLSTAINYQGQLQQGGNPVNATADFQFTLFDALSGPNQIGSMVPVNNITISGGNFTVPIDFGAAAFDGNDRFLQIAVRSPAGGGAFQTLTPRQKLAATPYALQTRGIYADATGNIGIGTTTPNAPLHIASDPFAVMVIQDTGPASTQAGYVSYRNNAMAETGFVGYGTPGSPDFSISNARSGGDVEIFTGVGGDIRLATNTQAMIVTAGGNVGIGTTSAPNRLSVNGSAHFSGVVGIGTTIPVSQLQVVSSNGTAIVGECFSGIGVTGVSESASAQGIGVQGICADAAGFDFFANGTGINYGASSSIRWKHDIEPINGPLERIAQMRGVYFDWNEAHGGHHDVGMIAEEVGKVLPEIVVYEENGIDAIGMDYSKLTPLLVEAVKALRAEKDAQRALQQQQIAAQGRLIDDLKSQNDELQKRLESLEESMHKLASFQSGGVR